MAWNISASTILIKRRDWFRRVPLPHPVPIIQQLLLVYGSPLKNHRAHTAWRVPLHDCNRRYANKQFIAAVNRVKMGRCMIIIEHANAYTIELRYDWH